MYILQSFSLRKSKKSAWVYNCPLNYRWTVPCPGEYPESTPRCPSPPSAIGCSAVGGGRSSRVRRYPDAATRGTILLCSQAVWWWILQHHLGWVRQGLTDCQTPYNVTLPNNTFSFLLLIDTRTYPEWLLQSDTRIIALNTKVLLAMVHVQQVAQALPPCQVDMLIAHCPLPWKAISKSTEEDSSKQGEMSKAEYRGESWSKSWMLYWLISTPCGHGERALTNKWLSEL